MRRSISSRSSPERKKCRETYNSSPRRCTCFLTSCRLKRTRIPSVLDHDLLYYTGKSVDGTLLYLPLTLQDSSPPSVVRRGFFAVGMAACGCHAHSKNRREPPEAARNLASE